MQRRAAGIVLWSWVLAILVAGCGGGGGSSGSAAPAPPAPAGSPTIQVLPASYDFGAVTSGNTPAPLEVTIRNTGTAALRVTAISQRAPADPSFTLRLNNGARPCSSSTPTIAASDSCTFQIAFAPSSNGAYAGTVDIASDDPGTPVYGLAIAGSSAPIATLGVQVNQLDTCPGNEVNAYLSVIDQGGYPLTNLLINNFSITQNNTILPVISASYVETVFKPIAIAAVMDHSGSLTDQPVAFNDMLTGFSNLFGTLGTNDLGEIVKFDSELEVVVPFTGDKAALVAAVSAAFDKGRFTRLYDATYQAVEDAGARTGYRRAVVVATDGADEGPTPGVQYSARSLNDVISNAVAKKVPIFTIGIGTSINSTVLQQMAGASGGVYYQANTSQNLATIYQQLTSILYQKQYTLKFDQQALGAGVPSSITFGVTSGGVSGSATAPTVSCN
jgi:Ca-activated chloride channel family protein